ncbi:UNVERIFIED_CONTAM: hypothetical protein FKN15_075902 [Acipenser sinensis]
MERFSLTQIERPWGLPCRPGTPSLSSPASGKRVHAHDSDRLPVLSPAVHSLRPADIAVVAGIGDWEPHLWDVLQPSCGSPGHQRQNHSGPFSRPRPQQFLAFPDFMEEVCASRDCPASGPSAEKLGLEGFPPVDPACPNPQCKVTETHLKRVYAAEAQATRLSNTASVLTAYMDGVLCEALLPELVATELRLLSSTLLKISGLQGQALGWSLASLIVARRQLWLSRARVPDTDKAVLLDAPISPGHTFWASLHSLRPADVKVIGAVGDSLTAGNGIGSSPNDLLDVLTQYRGLSWSVGGDESLSTVTTLPNILRQFNTSLKGFSFGTGKVNFSNAFLNQAVSGSTTIDIPGQIRKLVDIMKSDQFNTSLKGFSFGTGKVNSSNAFLNQAVSGSTTIDIPGQIRKLVDIMKSDQVSSLQGIPEEPRIGSGAVIQQGLFPPHCAKAAPTCRAGLGLSSVPNLLCGCVMKPRDNSVELNTLSDLNRAYQRVTRELVESGRYDTRDDFTVVLQPFFREVQIPLLPTDPFLRTYKNSNYSYPGPVPTQAPIKNFGSDLSCLDRAPSENIPTSAHKLRPADVKVVAALGDSITWDNVIRVMALLMKRWITPSVFSNRHVYSCLLFSIGGNDNLDTVTTLPNILKQFNPSLIGFSKGTGKRNSGFNMAVGGAKAIDIPDQANRLVQALRDSQDVDFQNDWKLVTVFIGGNDLCNYCNDRETYSVENYMRYIQDSLDILYREVPRVFVNLVMVLQMEGLRRIKSNTLGCTLLQTNLCPCSLVPGEDSLELSELKKINREYQWDNVIRVMALLMKRWITPSVFSNRHVYSCLLFSIGGNDNLDTVTTLPNILKQFNPSLIGFSKGTGKRNSGFNMAVGGAKAIDIPDQANRLVQALRDSQDVDFQNDWKLVTVFIGGNDLCNYCNDRETYSVENYMRYIQDSLDILYREVPRVFVNLVMVLQMEGLRRIKSNTLGCTLLQTNLCPCSLVPGEDSLELSELKKINREYQEVTERLVSSGRYDGRQDFTVVVQPFFRNSIIPLTIDGKPDLDFFSVDCFHFKERGQAEMSIELWNNMLEPVGQKHTFNNFTHDRSKLKCPSQLEPVGQKHTFNNFTHDRSKLKCPSQGCCVTCCGRTLTRMCRAGGRMTVASPSPLGLTWSARLLCDLLWSDPDKDVQGWGENDRGVSFTFGADVVVEDGYEFFAKRQLVTLFSAPNYCGEFDNAGDMMSILKPSEKAAKYQYGGVNSGRPVTPPRTANAPKKRGGGWAQGTIQHPLIKCLN